MSKKFNTYGACIPEKHYMVDLTSRLEAIKAMVDEGDYFTINRARQYGKTTILQALSTYLKNDYHVVSLDFQRLGSYAYENEAIFMVSFSRMLLRTVKTFPNGIREQFDTVVQGAEMFPTLQRLFKIIEDWCGASDQPVVLLIDEVDTATNNQIFLDFLAQLRAEYLNRFNVPTFQSVILAGVYDVRSIKRKIRPQDEHKENSPWNIAAKFNVDMYFSANDIAGMLKDYETDYQTGMNIQNLADLIFEYTSGYPFLVSDICKIVDEELPGREEFPQKADAWTDNGVREAIKRVIKEDNPLYESMMGKLVKYPELKSLLQELLFNGQTVLYASTASYIKDATMFGFIRNENESVAISNRIFESVLYNNFISEEFTGNKLYTVGAQEKNQFIVAGHLDIRRIMEKFIEAFGELYGKEDEAFLEKVGRKYFLLFLKPIINGIGNYSIEPQTRNSERMDLVIFYRSEQNILELKIWHGNSYNERGEKQLSGYLDYFHMKKGYMLSFNFNKKKSCGIREIVLGDKVLIEGVV
ncbi:MAG: ATP-binding protein [Lachnospiraceae bacterium]|nr:ATP-binding protein [Lachnospiraceae bacterium]